MSTPHRRRPLLWIALIAWFAQLCLPAAHAAAMAQQEAGIAVWCGVATPGLQAELAKLDHEIRTILDPGSPQADSHDDCAAYCASASSADPVVEPASVRLRAAGLEAAPRPAVESLRAAPWRSPPVRGPPYFS